MKIQLINKERIKERIKNLGTGILLVIIGIFFAVLMIAWLLYSIFISSKG
ncbi:hypothetical protein [Candidatus Methanoperedens nitratireducens]|uniref:Uncharacterized protein n=1 Tax=Candidatus Methanoperedens nitratireducens TaxID=1392998 RepID=A0A284VQG3_9EURY|nr:hypothetical protein [Candidatus Methanoperedens nitroreducens]SNQ61443.1 hypothetical protein MNV_360003 [Candidatus Methanoperedens nitroreducens]